jgi:uncharacterized protein
MRIEVEKLTERGESLARVYTPDELPLEDEFARVVTDVRVEGRASRRGGEVLVAGTIDTAVELRCDRCANPIPFPVKLDFKAELVAAAPGEVGAEATELQAEDLDRSFFDGEFVEVDDLVREQILLALPARQLCRDECKGLCPTCGIDLNAQPCDCAHGETDPRWSALAEIKKEVNGES